MKSMSRWFTKRMVRVGTVCVPASLLATFLGVPLALAQSANPVGDRKLFTSEALHLTFTYPSALEQRDVNEAMVDGHLTVPGLSTARGEMKGGVAACLRPLLLARTPQPEKASTTMEKPAADGSETIVTVTPSAMATLLLAELDPNCLSGAEQVSGRKELPVMAQQFLATPGMVAVANPASYTIGSQKVFMAAAQGHPEMPAPAGSDAAVQPTRTPFTIFTMAVSTTWNSHLLVWLMSSNQIALLDQVSKSTVRFGRGAEAPLYPQSMGNENPSAAPPQ